MHLTEFITNEGILIQYSPASSILKGFTVFEFKLLCVKIPSVVVSSLHKIKFAYGIFLVYNMNAVSFFDCRGIASLLIWMPMRVFI